MNDIRADSPVEVRLSWKDVQIRAYMQFNALVVCFLCAIPLLGQSATDLGQIIGVVKDPDQAVNLGCASDSDESTDQDEDHRGDRCAGRLRLSVSAAWKLRD